MINMSPWSVADRSGAFLGGVPEKRVPQANFYPQGMRRSEWGPWFIKHDARRQAEALGPNHVIRRDSSGVMKTVPFNYERAFESVIAIRNDAAMRQLRLMESVLTKPAQAFHGKYAQQPAGLERLRERFAVIPYDLEPRFPLSE